MSDQRDLKMISDLMDNRFKGPFGWRFGWDGILGLIPVIGDVVTSSISIYLVVRAGQLGTPPSVLLRMCGNVLVESIVDVIPFVGNLFDFAWKANAKNLRLLERYMAEPKKVTLNSQIWVGVIVALFILAVLAVISLAVFVFNLFISVVGR